jgi:carbon storage regulator
MLVLTRKKNQKIVVGDNIEIVVCRVDRHRVRLGVEAPRDVFICRGELSESELCAKRRWAEADD